jgi:hypothetical protein
MHRELTLRIKTDMTSNWNIIQLIRVALQVAFILLLRKIAAWPTRSPLPRAALAEWSRTCSLRT